MKYFLCLLATLLINYSSKSQTSLCGSDWLPADPAVQSLHEQLEQQAFDYFSTFQGHQNNPDAPHTVLRIPVVVHIIHDNGPENISDAQVQQAIAWLNAACANSGYFDQGSGTDVGIEFCLAQRAPNGLTTNGITRDQSPLTNLTIETQDVALKNLNRWAPKQYLNIWLVRAMCSTSAGCGVAAYAYRPEYHGSSRDGLVIEAQYFGAVESQISLAAHELGHYLGLYHTFEGGCTNNNCLTDGDRICDTPPDQSTAGVACGQTVNTCSTDTQSGFTTDQPDMTSNYLDYGDPNCWHDFTPGQAERMNFYLNGIRHSLLDSKGCSPACPALVVSAFTPSATTISPGQTVTFTNTSQNAATYQWSVNGAPFSTDSNLTYIFDTIGTYTVTLLAQSANATLCDPATSQVTIQVICPAVAGFTVSNPYPAENEVVTLTNTSQNATIFSWTIDGVAQGATLPTVSFAEAGSYTIQLTAGNGLCQSSVQQEIFVEDSCTDKTFQFMLTGSDLLLDWQGLRVVSLMDGNLLMISRAVQSLTITKTILTKFSTDGTQLWSKQITEPYIFNQQSLKHNIVLCATPDGGFAFTKGEREDNNFFNQVIKISSNGSVEWSRKFQNTSFTAIKMDFYGNIIAYGYHSSIGKIFFAKFDLTGNLIWSKSFSINLASSYQDQNRSLECLPDGSIITSVITSIPNIDYKVGTIIFKIDSSGNLLWAKNLTISNANTYRLFTRAIVATSDSVFYLVSIIQFAFTYAGTSITKITSTGQIIWSKYYLVNEYDATIFTAGKIAETDGIVLSGYTTNSYYGSITKIDSSGHPIWQRHYKQNEYTEILDIAALPNANGYVLMGTKWNVDKFRPWILKTDAIGFAGSCDPASISIQTTDLAINDSLLTFPEAVPPVAESVTVAIADIATAPTLLCARACPYNPEICDNNLDDDGDGLFDCLDPDCPCTVDSCHLERYDNWYFGQQAGLDFSTEPPTMQNNGQTNSANTTATISDNQGNLLFYTDGHHIFNRFHQIMPQGTNPQPLSNEDRITSTIVPHPGNPALYYVFISDHFYALYYALIDMRLDNGKGDVVPEVYFKKFNATPKYITGIAATRSCLPNKYWLALHAPLGKELLAYAIDEDGLHLDPTVTPINELITGNNQMKFSPQGKQLALLIGNSVVLYSFEVFASLGGLFSNPKTISTTNAVQYFRSVEYSPTGRYLYVTSEETSKSVIYQFDLEAGDVAAIANSKIVIATEPSANNFINFQLAPNGKIYIAHGVPDYKSIDVIHQPDAPGVACQYQQSAIILPLADQSCRGFSNSISTDFRQPHIAFSDDAKDSICTLNNPVFYQILPVPCNIDSSKWSLLGVTGTVFNFDVGTPAATVIYTSPGQGQLVVTIYTPCGQSSDTLSVTVFADLNKTLDLGPDQTVCDNGVVTFNAGSGFTHYRWQDGSTDSLLTTLLPGKYWVDVYDACGNLQTDTVIVSIAPNSVLSIGPDIVQCAGLPMTFQRPAFFTEWQWSPATFINCDTCTSITANPVTTTTWTVIARNTDGCLSLDTLHWRIVDTLPLTRDITVCLGETIDLYGVTVSADTTVHFLRPNTSIGCDTLWTIHTVGVEVPTATVQAQICPNQFFLFQDSLLLPNTTTIFHVSSSGCDSVITVIVTAFPPVVATLPADTSLSIGASLILNAIATGTGQLSFDWQPSTGLDCTNCLQPAASPLDTITYTFLVTDANGCSARDSITLRINPDCQILIPNAFTPNGDGTNDWFYPITFPCVHQVRLWRVLNRWGTVVFERSNFEPNQENLGWDGNGQPSDVFIWIAELEHFDGRVEQRHGQVVLLR